MWGVRGREEWYLTLSCFVLPLAGVGKNWKGAYLGRKSPVLFDIVRLRCLSREMGDAADPLLLRQVWLVLNSLEACLWSSDSCSCLSPHTLLNFRIQTCQISVSYEQKPLFSKSLSANVCTWKDYVVIRKVKSLYLAAKQISQITLELWYMIGI